MKSTPPITLKIVINLPNISPIEKSKSILVFKSYKKEYRPKKIIEEPREMPKKADFLFFKSIYVPVNKAFVTNHKSAN